MCVSVSVSVRVHVCVCVCEAVFADIYGAGHFAL